MHFLDRKIAVSAVAMLIAMLAAMAAMCKDAGKRLQQPLPLEVVVSLRTHNAQSPIDLSPDGEWVAHTLNTESILPQDNPHYSASGFSFAAGHARTEAVLTHTRTGEVISLGSAAHASWAPVWSPDGSRVAFYSDEGGEAGVWIWERATGKAWRFPGVIVRPWFGFETVQWTADGTRVLCKILPASINVQQASALVPDYDKANFESAAVAKMPVVVRRFPLLDAASEVSGAQKSSIEWRKIDLALLDVRSKQVIRLVERTAVAIYRFSSDERFVAYTITKEPKPNRVSNDRDLAVLELSMGTRRIVSSDLRLEYGMAWHWSPKSDAIAYIAEDASGKRQIAVVHVSTGATHTFDQPGLPSFRGGEYPPLWSPSGDALYAVHKSDLWRLDVRSGQGRIVASTPGWELQLIVSPPTQSTVETFEDGRELWVLARRQADTASGLLSIDLRTARVRHGLQEKKGYLRAFNIDTSQGPRIAFVASDASRLHDLWTFNTQSGEVRQVSRINGASLDRYALGRTRTIQWQGIDGQKLKGALLLPSRYAPGQRAPLVVWVYGGAYGSATINQFGLGWSYANFNFQVLATRGYAVLYPDAPLRSGEHMADLLKTVMPGVNAAIDQGYADPERLALMGQSYGSYSALALITQTTRFKAAVLSAVSMHPALVGSYLTAPEWYERGQPELGVSLWEDPQRYVRASPLFLFQNIQTPVLIGQGDTDADRWRYAEAVFAALQRLEKPVEYRLYRGEGHVLTQPSNVIDFWRRRLDFLAEHLDLEYDANGHIVIRKHSQATRLPDSPDSQASQITRPLAVAY